MTCTQVRVPFSQRTAWDRGINALTRALAERSALPHFDRPLLDLTASNPTRCGLAMPPEQVLGALASADALRYAPEPFGRLPAREAVAAYYSERGANVAAAQLCLTASTSEAYSFLFRLLCDPGDEVLLATPSYPLFDYLAALDAVHLRSYPLLYDHGWALDAGALRDAITPRTRAIAVVHPNNPTGHFTTAAERAALEQLCMEHGLALIVDEVFLDYGWAAQTGATFAAGPHPALTFVLSGLSKLAALPQMKVSWIAVCGPDDARAEALARLDVIADTFLSVSAPAQVALPMWLAAAKPVRHEMNCRLRRNLGTLDKCLGGTPVTRLAGDAGWYAVLRVPATQEDEAFALALLDDGVLVHPGSAFGFGASGYVVVSLLPEPDTFAEGIHRLVHAAGKGV